MFEKIKTIFIIIFLIYGFMIFYDFVFAQGGGGTTGGGGVVRQIPNPLEGECNQLNCVIAGIISKLAQLAIPVVVIMVLIGGFQILTSGGNEEKIRTGKTTLWWAVIGYIVILLANGLVLIIQSILKS